MTGRCPFKKTFTIILLSILGGLVFLSSIVLALYVILSLIAAE